MSDTSLAIQFLMVDGVTAGLRRVSGHLSQMGEQGKRLAEQWDKATNDFKVGTKVLLGTKTAWEQAVKPGLDAAAELQDGLLKLEAELMEGGKGVAQIQAELATLKSTAQAIGNPLPLDINQVLEAELALRKAGLAIKDIAGEKGAAAASSFMAVLESIDPGQAADVVGKVGSQFKIEGAQYFDLADQISRASSSSATSALEMASALTYVGSRAARLGIDYKTTLALLAAEAPGGLVGSQAGTSLEAFLGSITAPSSDKSKGVMKALNLNFFDKGGAFVGLDTALEQITQAESKLNQRQKEAFRSIVFGDQGSRAAAALLDAEGGYKRILGTMDQQVGIQDKVAKRLEGHTGQSTALLGTMKSIVADGFQPMVGLLTKGEAKANELASGVAAWQAKHPGVNKVVSTGAAAAVASAAAYGIFRLVRGGSGAAGVFGQLGPGGIRAAFLSGATGIAQGKAVEAATGVTPVFVTNWPGGMGGGGGGGAKDIVGGAADTVGLAQVLQQNWHALKAIATLPALSVATGSLGGAAMTAGGALAAGAIGYGIGTVIQDKLEKSGWAAKGQEALAKALASVGSDWGKAVAEDFRREREAMQKPEVNVTVNVDAQGRATVDGGEGLDSATVQARRNSGGR